MTNGGTQKKRKQPPATNNNPEAAMETPLQTEKVRKAKKLSEWIGVAYLDSLHPCFTSDCGHKQKKVVQERILLAPEIVSHNNKPPTRLALMINSCYPQTCELSKQKI